eukprot:gnl/Dysnectes_brevis/2524_a3030_2062.p1 GENE.gnl/Dysnectes_brevis/2524_a3030_2062~~gnl/Dysnectes_brevis/2524_a3030_2062.p1  ORF type:complete len:130 (+),score=18.88 gnl/Dysnectes_brevis/2524_a3030_2062:47-436(+)
MSKFSSFVLLLVALLSVAYSSYGPVPDEYYPPPTPPYGTPVCTYINQTYPYPYYFSEDCTQTTTTEYCHWTYDVDCRTSAYCPSNYDISCTQYDYGTTGQVCVWEYTMNCPSTKPAPVSCPWEYTISCQ